MIVNNKCIRFVENNPNIYEIQIFSIFHTLFLKLNKCRPSKREPIREMC